MAEEKKPVQEPEQEANTEPAEESAKAAEKEKKKKKSEKIPKEDYDRLQAEFDSHKQQHLRVLAEYDNFRKRSANEALKSLASEKSVRLASRLTRRCTTRWRTLKATSLAKTSFRRCSRRATCWAIRS